LLVLSQPMLRESQRHRFCVFFGRFSHNITHYLRPNRQTLSPAQPTTTDQGGVGAGPVGQPAATTASAGAPTPYTYTTVINGVTSVLEDIFTPTSPATVSTSIPATGTILDFDTWSSLYGPPPKSEASSIPISIFTLFFMMLTKILLL